MKNIAEIDKNLAVETAIQREGLAFYDVRREPFRLHGVFWKDERFRRFPEEVAKRVSEAVYKLHTHGAGGRVRFVTDSPYVAIKTVYTPGKMPHFALSGSAGYDMYVGSGTDVRYAGTFMPPFDVTDGYENVIDFFDEGEREVTINFPLYSSVQSLYIGLKEGCVLKEASDYRVKKPVVYYGSSITQGGCASKPGSSYESILSRWFDCDYINLGFSGNAKAEDEMVNYIKGLEMSVFVMDYDHNAPNADYLEKTHQKMFQAIRAAQPELPILLLPRPRYYWRQEDERRHEIVYLTYQEAKAAGDEHVYFISGRKLMEMVGDNGSVDNTHPTDSGFLSMATAIAEVFKEIGL